MRPFLRLSSADFSGSFLARAVALSVALSGAAGCDGHLAGPSSDVDALDATTPPPSIDGSASSSPPTGDAAVVDLLVDSGPPPYDSASVPLTDASLPRWGYGLDASPPASFDASCGVPAEDLLGDAAPNTCELTPADVACATASDCSVLMVGHCCSTNLYGMNRSSQASCPMPPCIPPPPGSGCNGGFVTDDCSNVPSLSDVGVACIDHQCRTFATVAP